MALDVLDHLPAKPSTPVPGTYILPLLTNQEIHVRRYGLSPSSLRLRPSAVPDQGEKSSSDEILGRLRNDPLERSWKAVSDSGTEGLEGVLQGCGVVVQEEEAVGRVLWVFSTEGQGQGCAGMQELLPRPPSLHPSNLFSCSRHGHELSCLSSKLSTDVLGDVGLTNRASKDVCNLRWTTAKETIRAWSYLQDAVVEKLAWKGGKRMTTRRGMYDLLGYPPLQARLQPLPSGALLLTLVLKPKVTCHPTFLDSLGFRYRPLLLLPFGLPALLVGPHSISSVQAAKLNVSFEQILGPRWADNREAQRMATQLGNEVNSDWSVYWVPTLEAIDQRQPVADSDPIELAESWLKGQGVLTTWPTHLIFDLTPRPRSSFSSSRITTPLDLPNAPGLMEVVANLFDFMSNYREPPPAENTPPEVVDLVTAVMEERQPETPLPIETSFKTSPADDKSDFDDLFSTHSGSPDPLVRADDAAGEYEASRLYAKSESEQLIMTDEGPTFPINASRIRSPADDIEVEADATFVTEDDFDFFDAPNQVTDAPNKSTESAKIYEPHEPVPQEPLLKPSTEISLLTPPYAAPTSPKGQVGDTEPPLMSVPPPKVLSAEEMFKQCLPLPSPPSVPEPERSVIPTRATKKQFEDVEMMPPPFEPVDLPHSDEQLLSLAYALPSPAPTPESLRPELIERIQQSKKETFKHDYASGWDVESEISSLENDDAVVGAPPTPISELDSEEDSIATTPVATLIERSREDDEDIEYDGERCVGPEWTTLRLDEGSVANLAVPWRQSWPGSRKVRAAPPRSFDEGESMTDEKADRFFKSFDHSALATALISNRFLRVAMTRTSSESQLAPSAINYLFDVPQETVKLADLTRQWEESKANDNPLSRPIPQCSVHTGFAGNVMQASMTGLKFWQELGLQPVGGAKNVTAYVVCEAVPGMRRLGERASRGLKRSYEAMRLGAHNIGRDHNASAGIVVTQPGGLCSTISSISSTATGNTVLYALVDAASGGRNSLPSLFRESSVALPTLAVYVVPIDAIQDQEFSTIALEVYNRIPKVIRRVAVRGHAMDDHEPQVFMHYPTFTLAPAEKPRPSLSLAWPLRSYDVLTKWRLIHGAYSYSATTELLFGFVVDAEGDNWEVRTWPLKRHHPMANRVEKVWELFASFAIMAAIEHRIAVCSLGHFTSEELNAWNSFEPAKKVPLTLLMTDLPGQAAACITRPSPPPSSITSAILHDPSSRLIDESLLAHTATLSFRQILPLPSKPDQGEPPEIIFPRTTFMLSMATPSSLAGEWTTATYHVLTHRPPPGKENEEVDELLSSEYHRLTCLGRLRFGFEGCLPAHLEGVRCVQDCLEGLVEGWNE